MQPQQIIEALKGICDNTTVAAALRVQSAYGFLMGVAAPAATSPRRSGNATPEPARTRGRPRLAEATAPATRTRTRRAAATPAKPPLGEQVYALIPSVGGIAQAALKLRGVKPNIIGNALSRLKKAGRIVSQGEGKTTTWFREGAQQQAA